jgi:hypothetical protein
MADFFHPRAGRAVKHSQQLGRAAAGPTGHPVSSMSGYPYSGWHDSSREPSVITDVISCEAISFQLKGEARSWTFMLSRYVLLKSTLLWCWVFREVFRPLYSIRTQVPSFERFDFLLETSE